VSRRDDWLIRQLPMGMLDDGFFVRFTSLFQDVATSYLEGADNITNVVDVTVAPPEVVRWLGSWIALDSVDSSLDEALQRRLVRQAGKDMAWRGTRRGLQEFLAVVTGGPVTVEESGGIGREGELGARHPFVRVRVASTGWMSASDFVTLVADEVPANVQFEIWLPDRRLWPQDVDSQTDASPSNQATSTRAPSTQGETPDGHG
jgi:phage tail-like protein